MENKKIARKNIIFVSQLLSHVATANQLHPREVDLGIKTRAEPVVLERGN